MITVPEKTTVVGFANIRNKEIPYFWISLFSCSYHNDADVLLLDFVKFLFGPETYHCNLCVLIMWKEKSSNSSFHLEIQVMMLVL